MAVWIIPIVAAVTGALVGAVAAAYFLHRLERRKEQAREANRQAESATATAQSIDNKRWAGRQDEFKAANELMAEVAGCISKLIHRPHNRDELKEIRIEELVCRLDVLRDDADHWTNGSDNLRSLHLNLSTAGSVAVGDDTDVQKERTRTHEQVSHAFHARKHLQGARDEIARELGPLADLDDDVDQTGSRRRITGHSSRRGLTARHGRAVKSGRVRRTTTRPVDVTQRGLLGASCDGGNHVVQRNDRTNLGCHSARLPRRYRLH